MQLHWSIRAAGMGLCLSLITSGAARAASFTFTRIADTSTFSSFFSGPSINNNGTVAFSATLATGETGVFTGSGGPTTTIALSDKASGTNPVFSSVSSNPSINDVGTIAFGANITNASAGINSIGIFTGTGISDELTAIANLDDGLTLPAGYVTQPVINDAGVVAFTASLLPSTSYRPSIFVGNGGPLATLVPASQIDGIIRAVAINNAGTIAFSAGTTYLEPGGIFSISSSGGPISTIGPGGSCLPISINQVGTLAISCFGPAAMSSISTESSGNRTTIAFGSETTRLTPFFNVSIPSINDEGEVAFLAQPLADDIAYPIMPNGNGIFIGSNPVADHVIASGDSLFGSTVSDSNVFDYRIGPNIGFSTKGLNNRGQLAFYARFTDGTSGIFRADPITIPESSFSMLSAFWLSALGAGAMLKRCRKEVS